MECLYCGTALAPLRGATDGGYCSDDHRLEHAVENSPAQYLFLLDPPKPSEPLKVGDTTVPIPSLPGLAAQKPSVDAESEEAVFRFHEAGLLPWFPVPVPREPKQRKQPLDLRLTGTKPAILEPILVPYTPCLQPDPPPPFFSRAGAFALRHWKLSLAVLPLAFVGFIDNSPSPSHPSVQKQSTTHAGPPALLSSLRNTFKRRAAVQFSDDFRSGLDDWSSNKNLATSWTYDEAGFVRPGALAVYRPTMDLEDYSVEFLGEIEQKGIGMAFRVVDWDHYYALKLVVLKPGPQPEAQLVRYAVEGNKEVARVSRTFPVPFRDTSLCRFRLDVHGNEFTLINQGNIVDDWTDDRYPRGGVGFFCGKGERARLRWVEVSHQNDPIGRVCALFAQ